MLWFFELRLHYAAYASLDQQLSNDGEPLALQAAITSCIQSQYIKLRRNHMIESFGQEALFSMFLSLFCIGLSFWALQSLRLDQLFRKNQVARARMLYLLLSIAIGSAVSSFFLNYLQWARQLPLLF